MNYYEIFITNAAILGCFILYPIMVNMLKMMNSMSNYYVKECTLDSYGCDVYLLCDRIEDLENDIVILKRLVNNMSNLHKEEDKEYVDMIKYKKDHLHMNDLISINKYDITEIHKQINKLETKIDDLDSLTMK